MRSLRFSFVLIVSSGILALAQTGSKPPAKASAQDTASRSIQERGRKAMGVDQYTSTHGFDALPTGGRIELLRNTDDSAGVAQIRAHKREIAPAFKSGDFSTPDMVHMQEVSGRR